MSSKIFFIADTHFGDSNILNYENRPFKNTSDMDKTIINNWNSVVKNTDSVYVVGDFGAKKQENQILEHLNGKKFLIKGNHDIESNNYYRKAGFLEVYDKPIILNEFWIISHKPLYMNINMPYANIFGHIHNSPLFKDFSSHHYCVSVERINYTPISFEKIIEKMK